MVADSPGAALPTLVANPRGQHASPDSAVAGSELVLVLWLAAAAVVQLLLYLRLTVHHPTRLYRS